MADKNITLKRKTSSGTDNLYPSTTWGQIDSSTIPSTFTPTSHTHGNINDDGRINTSAIIATGDHLIIADHSSSNDLTGSSITFDTSNSTDFLRKDGTFATPAGTTFNGGTITNDLNITNEKTILMSGDYYVNKKFDMLENASPQYILLCASGQNNEVMGTLHINRSSSNYQAATLEVVVSSRSNAAVQGAALRTLQVLQSSERYEIVLATYSGTQYIAIKYSGHVYPETVARFTGRMKSTGSAALLTTVGSSDVSSVSAFDGTTYSSLDVDTMHFRGNVGIGTESPTAVLDVNGALNLKGRAFGDSDGTNSYLKSGTSGSIFFETNGGTRGKIDTSGNFGIGTISPAEKLDVDGNIIVSGDNRYMTFGTPGAGTTTGARFFSIEGNTDTSGEGSGRIFFTEHNSSTAGMDKYGMSLGYRGGASSIEGASGNTWSGLSQISNGQWGMWGHNNSEAGALVMSGDRAATFIDFHSNELRNVNIANARYFDTYRRDTIDSASEDFNDFTTSGTFAVNNWSQSGDVVQNGPTNTAAGNAYGWGMLRVTNFQSTTGTGNGYVVQEYIPHVSDTHYVRFQWNGTWTSWRAAWGSDNDGAGSGVDADLLDGQHGSYYTNYTDTAISNLVASAPGTLDTLNELAAAINDDASFASTITTQLTGKAKRIDLTNQVQLTSYRKSVIALCNVDNSVISRNSWSGGTILFHRTNGLTAPVTAHITMEKRYNATGANYTSLVMSGNSFGDEIQYVTFDYNGNTYGGIEFFFSNAELAQVYFIGESNFDIFGLDYYNTQTSTVLNSEVNNSISTTNMTAETDFFFNNQKIFHEGNDGSTSGLDAQYLQGIPVGSFVRSDASDTMSGDYRIESGSFASLILDRGTTGSGSVVQFENNNGIIGGIGAYGDDGLQFRTTDGTQMVIDSSNRVGIGTTTPTEKLTVYGASTTSENSPVTYIKHNFTGTHGFGLSVSRDNSDIAALALGANSSNQGIVVSNNTNLLLSTISSGSINSGITVKTDGYVGIGATNPSAKLDVEGAGIFNSDSGQRVLYLRQGGAGSGNIIQFQGASNENVWEITGRDTNFYIYNNDLSKRAIYIEDSTNYIGINNNTTPSYPLDVYGDIRAVSSTSSKIWVENTGSGQASLELKNSEGRFRLITDGGAFELYDETDSARRFFIHDNGNIQLNNSVIQLNANGNILTHGNLYLNSDNTNADSFIYFGDSASDTEHRLYFDDSAQQFTFSNRVTGPSGRFGAIESNGSDVDKVNFQLSGTTLTITTS